MYGPEYQAHLRKTVLVDSTHGTVAVFPDLHWGCFGCGAFVAGPDVIGTGIGTPLFNSSFYDDPEFTRPGSAAPHTAIETVFVSSQAILNSTGRIYVAISDGLHGGVKVYVSVNGGVDWTDTVKGFDFWLDDPNNPDPNVDHRRTMREKFVRIAGGVAPGK